MQLNTEIGLQMHLSLHSDEEQVPSMKRQSPSDNCDGLDPLTKISSSRVGFNSSNNSSKTKSVFDRFSSDCGKGSDVVPGIICDQIKTQITKFETGREDVGASLCDQIEGERDGSLEDETDFHNDVEPAYGIQLNEHFQATDRHNEHKTFHSRKTLDCDQCHKQFTLLSNLETHVKTKHGEDLFICNICNERFNDKRQLVSHKKMHTSKNRSSVALAT